MTILPGVVQLGPCRESLAVRLRSRDCEGDLGVVEMVMAAGNAGPPLHIHPSHGEGFYVLTGDMTFQVGEEVVTGGPGTWVFAPRNAPHALGNFGAVDARVLCVFAPGGFERRFERMLAEQAGQPLPEPTGPERTTRFVGPPLSAPATS